jgi:hypothetical protein
MSFKALPYACFAAALLMAPPSLGEQRDPSPFEERERPVAPSPVAAFDLRLPPGEKVVDLEASPGGGEVVVLVSSPGSVRALIWKPGETPAEVWKAPAGTLPRSITWHPEERALFVLATTGAEHQILRLQQAGTTWTRA